MATKTNDEILNDVRHHALALELPISVYRDYTNWLRTVLEAKDQQTAAAVKAERERVVNLIKIVYDKEKVQPIPYVIPKACPSKSHYKERHSGFLSGLLVAIKTLTTPKD